ncbi:MAG: hypothetical protein Q7U57_16310 [Methylovulum sp.]|nr:hypothetical protein [Methylovulum sp.]
MVDGAAHIALGVVLVFANGLVGGVNQLPEPAQVVIATVDDGRGTGRAVGIAAVLGAVVGVVQAVGDALSGGVAEGTQALGVVVAIGGGAGGRGGGAGGRGGGAGGRGGDFPEQAVRGVLQADRYRKRRARRARFV